ncbi:Cell division protein FtsL [subsurface metagenome]
MRRSGGYGHTERRPDTTNKLKLYSVVFSVIILLVLYVGLQVASLTLGEQIREIQDTQAVVDIEIKQLEMEVAELRKGSRIKKIAIEELGLVMPEGAPVTLY